MKVFPFMSKDEFKPELPKRKVRVSKGTPNYSQKVLKAASKRHNPKAQKSPPKKYKFTGSRIGRGRAAGSLAASRNYHPYQRRVVVRARIAKFGAGQLTSARAHLSYIQRGDVTKEGEKGRLYDATSIDIDGKSFLETCKGDRHQFRFIVSPENGHKLQDLKPFIRDLMRQVEYDLETKLEWVAVDHFNTGHPHSHIVVRGKDDRGENLVIARDYISHGIRHRAENLMTLELGPQNEYELQTKLSHEINLERFTHLDREILMVAKNDLFKPSEQLAVNLVRQSLYLRRLKVLEELGLALQNEGRSWKLSPKFKKVLQQLGERADTFERIEKQLHSLGINRPACEVQICEPREANTDIKGQLIAHGLVDELRDQRYCLIDGVDGYVHYANIGSWQETELPKRGMVAHLATRPAELKTVDKTISEIATKNDGIYSTEKHQLFDARASPEFIETHTRRLEALRSKNLVQRFEDRSWNVGSDYLEKAKSYDQMKVNRQPLSVTTLSYIPLEQLATYDGVTWLDQELLLDSPSPIVNAHYGAKTMKVFNKRKDWLIKQGLGEKRDGIFKPKPGLLTALQRRELVRTGMALSQELKLNFVETSPGETILGTYRRPVQLAQNKYALIERAYEFTLVPWRPVLERARGKTVSGIMQSQSISWNINKKRGLGIG